MSYLSARSGEIAGDGQRVVDDFAARGQQPGPKPQRQRVELPLIRGDGEHLINSTSEELDASLWGE